jgi:hypothetical protein
MSDDGRQLPGLLSEVRSIREDIDARVRALLAEFQPTDA